MEFGPARGAKKTKTCTADSDCQLVAEYAQHFNQMKKEQEAVLEQQVQALDKLRQKRARLEPYLQRYSEIIDAMSVLQENTTDIFETLGEEAPKVKNVLIDFSEQLHKALKRHPHRYVEVRRALENVVDKQLLNKFESNLRSLYSMKKRKAQHSQHYTLSLELDAEIRRMTEAVRIKKSLVMGMRPPNTTCCPPGTPAAGRCRGALQDCARVGIDDGRAQSPRLSAEDVQALKDKFFGMRIAL